MLFVYVTTANMDEAKSIAAYIVEQRLASCANIFPEMHSIYHWQGKIENATECVCIFKTRQENYSALQAAIMEKHSYETPCIVALPVADAAPAFASWVHKESTKL